MKRIVIVTGASSGMGFEITKRFWENGDTVIAVDKNVNPLNHVIDSFKSDQVDTGVVVPEVVDVTSGAAVELFVSNVKNRFGACHVLVNCAGVFRGGMLHDSNEDDFDIQFAVNVKGIYYTIKYLVPLMLHSVNYSKSIVNISSLSGVNGDYNAPIYCASKAAVIGLTKAIALDYAELGIRCNCISPSATETPMFMNGSSIEVIEAFRNAIPNHKIGLPRNIADVVFFLCSDSAEHVIGNNITVDGGLSAWNGQPKQNKTN